MSKALAVNALLIAMSILPNHAPSIRMKALRFVPASTTAMFIGCPISFAFASPAAMTRCAFSRVIMTSSSLSIRRTQTIESRLCCGRSAAEERRPRERVNSQLSHRKAQSPALKVNGSLTRKAVPPW